MTAAELHSRCRALGIALAAGPKGALAWEADAEPPADLLADLARHKAELLGLLALLPADAADLAAWTCRAIEADLALPADSLTMRPLPVVCPGCEHCRPCGSLTTQ
jgi:hypothetical protein